MLKIALGQSDLQTANIALGCMRMAKLSSAEAASVIHTAYESGIDLFEHADIYGGGASEEVFAKGLAAAGIKRENILLQTKCGIRPGMFDFSKAHILSSVDNSLKRLNTDYLDVLALHRPDTLMDPTEVAEAFDHLHASGKVKYFGVSNQNVGQMALLSRYVNQKLIVNQLQFSIMHTPMIDAGFNVNMQRDDKSLSRDGGILEYTRLEGITIQAWSPYQYGFFNGAFIDHPDFPELNAKLEAIGNQYGISKTAVATVWILTHPANMQVVIGTMNVSRIRDITAASAIKLTRQQWYDIYQAAGNTLP
ncbi:MAG: aldo/keto reductase [Defluviitaleaceae bacterium]|nr:aldo/keto reductase [Defluviitaleaceae bacterium]